MKKVFISYAWKDYVGVEFVPWLQERLEVSVGERPWVDRSSLPSAGQSFRATIVESVAVADVVVVIVGPHARESEEVRSELLNAKRNRRPIIPLLIEDEHGNGSSLPDAIADLNLLTIDFRRRKDDSAAFERLVQGIEAVKIPRWFGSERILDPEYCNRTLVDDVLDRLLQHLDRPITSPDAAQAILLHGMSGVGKTMIAIACAYDYRVRTNYSRIVWLSGRNISELTASIRSVVAGRPESVQLEDRLQKIPPDQQSSEQEVQVRAALIDALRAFFRGGDPCFVVLDDAPDGNIVDVVLIPIQSSVGRVVITSQYSGVAGDRALPIIQVRPLERDESLSFLAARCHQSREALPQAAHGVAVECGGVPMALAVCEANARHPDGSYDWAAILAALKDAQFSQLSASLMQYEPEGERSDPIV